MKKELLVMLIMALFVTSVVTSCKKDKEEDGPKCESFTDTRDNQTYTAVKIGDQCWMAKNLNFATPTGSWCYANNNTNCNNYGRLYTWQAATTACPTGWKLPTDSEWKTLEMALGMSQADANITGWERGTDQSTKLKVNGSSGFNALIAGKKDPGSGPFGDLNVFGYFWSSTTMAGIDSKAWRRTLSPSEPRVFRGDFPKEYSFSVRCLKVE